MRSGCQSPVTAHVKMVPWSYLQNNEFVRDELTQPRLRGKKPHSRGCKGCRRRPTLPRALARSTIGAIRLNDRVRDGNGCGPDALVASESCTQYVARIRQTGWCDRRGSVAFRARPIHDKRVLCGIPVPHLGNPKGVSQATRAIRTAALGTSRDASTCCLSTESSPPALQGAQGSRENSSWGALPT
jgi:hypothetical protein